MTMTDNQNKNNDNNDNNNNTWEFMKENSAPLTRGRNIKQLITSSSSTRVTSAAAATVVLSTSVIEAKKRKFEKLVAYSEHCSDDDCGNGKTKEEDVDLLLPWLAYIKWTQDTFTSDTQAAFLLMERCTRSILQLSKEKRSKVHDYRNDTRFLRVAIRYADQTSRPMEIFKYFYDEKVGLNCAVYWVAWAWTAEKREEFKTAEKIFQRALSIDKGYHVKPLNFVEIRYKQFQRRMSRYWLETAKSNHDAVEDEDQRPALNQVRHHSSRSHNRRGRDENYNHRSSSRSSTQRTTSSHLDGSSRTRSSTAGFSLPGSSTNTRLNVSNSKSNENSGFTIFTEPKDDEEDPVIFNMNHNTRKLESEAELRKENITSSETWNARGGLLQNSTNSTTSTQPSSTMLAPFEIFVDEQTEDNCDHDSEEAKMKSSMTLAERYARDSSQKNSIATTSNKLKVREIDSVADKLHRDPLRYVKRCEVSSTTTRTNHQASSSNSGNFAFLSELVKQDLNFEQCRANAKSFTMYTGPIFNTLYVRLVAVEDEEDDMDMSTCSSDMITYDNNNSRTNTSQILPSATDLSNVSSTVNESIAVGGVYNTEDETINQKVARMDISMMFSSPTPAKSSAKACSTTDKNMANSDVKQNGKVLWGATSVNGNSTHVVHKDEDEENDEGEDTATFSVVHNLLSPVQESSPIKKVKNSDLFEIFEDNNRHKKSNNELVASEGEKKLKDDDVTVTSLSILQDVLHSHSEEKTNHQLLAFGDISHIHVAEDDLLDYNAVLKEMMMQSVSSYSLSNKHEYLPSSLFIQTSSNARRKKQSCNISDSLMVLNDQYHIEHEIGRGSNAIVYLCRSQNSKCTMNEMSALKVQKDTISLAHEFDILKKISSRLASLSSSSWSFTPKPLSFECYQNGAILEMSTGNSTSVNMNLLELLNVYQYDQNLALPELLVMHYAAQMLECVEILHCHARIMHADIKADNWVLLQRQNDDNAMDDRSLMLIDFGRSIDVASLLDNDNKTLNNKSSSWFAPDSSVTAQDMVCPSIRDKKSFGFDLDAFGLCASIYVLLFGSDIDIIKGSRQSSKSWTLSKQFRRYWHEDLWRDLFETLLNPPRFETRQYYANEMRRIRKEIVSYLDDPAHNRRDKVKALLRKQHNLITNR